MRVLLATTALVGLALLGYASRGAVSAQGQPVVAVGDKVTLWFADTTHGCTVVEVRGDFVKCAPGEPAQYRRNTLERWYNLRAVNVIEKTVRQE
jgi:hypothetical protein